MTGNNTAPLGQHPHWRWPRGVRPEDSLLLRRALRRLRKERGLTVAGAGKLFGVTAGNLSRAETGVRLPFSAPRLAAAFGIPVTKVLTPCPHCGYNPPAGYACLHCGSSERDAHRCMVCGYKAGTVYELDDHNRIVAQVEAAGTSDD